MHATSCRSPFIKILAGALALVACSGSPTGPEHIWLAPFKQMAREAHCAEFTNRLYLIDSSMVFHSRAGNCRDGWYGLTLYEATVDNMLCWEGETFCGPDSYCNDEESQALFEIIVENLDRNDLGLGSDHRVLEIDF